MLVKRAAAKITSLRVVLKYVDHQPLTDYLQSSLGVVFQ